MIFELEKHILLYLFMFTYINRIVSCVDADSKGRVGRWGEVEKFPSP